MDNGEGKMHVLDQHEGHECTSHERQVAKGEGRGREGQERPVCSL